MQPFKSFGTHKLLSQAPKELLTHFSVVGVKKHCSYAIDYSYKTLKQHKRIQTLTLIFPSLLSQKELKTLYNIQKFGCKIYFFTRKKDLSFEDSKILSQVGILLYYNQ
ncbi:hypothetical protein [Helicobacter mesocricetorum]|uniref:hypothetical protein n=1 Tax=Helicobacter mesocricetorum TaxID=87012 RepID=UPI000CF07B57|nr:hypothetical protein [Helicobacter mesocricetorum]